MEQVVISASHLQKSFGDNHVLQNISFNLNRGENLVVLGRSGSGKSVLIKCLVGLIPADAGMIRLFGEDIENMTQDDLNTLRKRIGFLFQGAALYDSMTVRENLAFPLRRSQHDNEEQLIQEALEQVGLSDAIDKMPAELSGGMRKRVGLARALMMRPEVILYDEPTTGLDPVTAAEISHLVKDIQIKYGTSSVIITHDMECAHIAGDRIMVLKDGTFTAEGTYDVLASSGDEWVRSFFNRT